MNVVRRLIGGVRWIHRARGYRAALKACVIASLSGLMGLPAARAEVANPLFGYTHIMSSPYTLPGGRLVLGTDAAIGLTDFLQVSTNLLRDFYKFYNVHGKLQLLDFEEFALALTLGFESYNLRDIASTNPDLRVTSWLPGVVTAFALDPQLALFVGTTLNLTQTELVTSGIRKSGYVHGATLQSDLSWAYNPKKKSIGNVLSTGVSYDINYSIFGLGVSHHWPGFHVGVHFYPNAQEQKVQPILAGGAVMDL